MYYTKQYNLIIAAWYFYIFIYMKNLEYAGFLVRVWALIIDTFLSFIIIMPILLFIYGKSYFRSSITFWLGPADFLVSYVLPFLVTIIFWRYCQATPGKMVIHSKIVDAKTGEKPTLGQYIGRYVAYFISAIFLGLGFLWIAFDKRKQGWHDKLAGTVVVRISKKVNFND